MKQFNDTELDALKKFMSAGTMDAAMVLSTLLNKKVTVSVPEAKIIEVTKIPEYLGGDQLGIVGLYFRIYGDITGSALIFFAEKQAELLKSILTADIDPGHMSEFDKMRESALMELGNIMVNSYLNALANYQVARAKLQKAVGEF